MRYSDRPIRTPAEDVLGRAGFALRIARSIDELEVAKDGFVISLEGQWGSGKTSLIELIIGYLAHIEMERLSGLTLPGETPKPVSLPELEEFAAKYGEAIQRVNECETQGYGVETWNYRFRANVLRTLVHSKDDAEEAERYWRLIQRLEENPRTIVVRFSPWLIAGRAELAIALLSELARAFGQEPGRGTKKSFAALIARLAELAPIAGAGVDFAGGAGLGRVLSAGGGLVSRYADRMSTGPTLETLRERLKQQLRSLHEQQILVIVDDLDRLTPREALEVVTLVKSLGDLPYVVYLLVFDPLKLHPLIGKGLNTDVMGSGEADTKEEGKQYIEKIVQHSISLPLITDDSVLQLLGSDLDRLFPDLSEDERERLSTAWHFVFRGYLKNLRDVRRFVNAVAVAHSGMRDYSDPIDLMILEALRLYEPDVYWQIREGLGDLVG